MFIKVVIILIRLIMSIFMTSMILKNNDARLPGAGEVLLVLVLQQIVRNRSKVL